jgi:mono/diheme cytochrome c family protein
MGEEAENKKGSHMPAVLGMLIAVSAVLSVPFLFIRYADRNAPRAESSPVDEEMLAGERVYQRSCLGCHEARGQGRPGQYPPLAGSTWLTEDVETPIRIMLLGVAGPMEVDGRRYDNVMPNFGVTLTDEDIARVLTFSRRMWGNKASAITVGDVARVRASLEGRHAPWKGGAELLEAKKAAPHP